MFLRAVECVFVLALILHKEKTVNLSFIMPSYLTYHSCVHWLTVEHNG